MCRTTRWIWSARFMYFFRLSRRVTLRGGRYYIGEHRKPDAKRPVVIQPAQATAKPSPTARVRRRGRGA